MPIQNRDADEIQIRELVNDIVKGIRDKNADRIVTHYTDSVLFILPPPLQYVGENGKKNLEAWFATFRGPIGYEVHNLTITHDENVAFCHSLNRICGTKSDGEHNDIWVRETMGFRKVNDEWKISHEHQSVPFYMDGSYKAAVDLKP